MQLEKGLDYLAKEFRIGPVGNRVMEDFGTNYSIVKLCFKKNYLKRRETKYGKIVKNLPNNQGKDDCCLARY